MSTQTIGPFQHHDTIGYLGRDGFELVDRRATRRHADGRTFPKPAARRPARQLDSAAVARIATAEIDRLLTPAISPIVDKLQAMGAQLKAMGAEVDRRKAHRDARREAERNATPPAGYVRDAASGEIRRRTTRDLAMANYAANGRDANGRRPGEPGYNFDGVAMVKAGATRQQINDAFWGRKA